MPVCELLATCPFSNEKMQGEREMAEMYKERYCQGDYTWCGRYMAFKALQRELKIVKSTVALVSRSKDDERSQPLKKQIY